MKKKKEVKREGNKLVSEAIKDLESEINRIQKEKSSLNTSLKNTDKGLENAREIERKLQERITRLEEKEEKLKDRTKRLKQKADSLGDRLAKVKVIKEQLGEV